ncbi:unnamed protein product [Rotaria sordida]|uniref:Uncharacterized protein n=1 Tax=Rotaria sordida TaxID=392033 RepID=A0A814ZMU8_9BILA|nr:unnamed protein product [Rotaria sordida]
MYNNLDMLDDANIYKKSYKTYGITNTEQKYKLVIFPSDNTFSIVNNKQCSNSEHDGLITVRSGGAGDNLRHLKQTINNSDSNACEDLRSSPQRRHSKRTKATNIKSKRQCTMAELHEAQKLLGKAMNTDIESDYNPEQENKMKTKTITIVKQQSKEPTITSLSDIPFGGLGKAFKNVTINSQSKNVHSTLGMHKKGAGDNLRHLKQTINNSDSNACEDLRSSLQRRHSKRTKATNIKSKRQCTSSKKSTPLNTAISTPSSTFMVDTQLLEYDDDDDSDYENKPPPRKPSNQITPSSSSISILHTPKSLAGRKILGTNDDNNDDNEQPSKKELIYIPLEEPNVEQPVEEKTFETIMMYKNPNDGNDVDLLSIPGVKQKMNLYVTSLIDIIFTHEELLQLDATKIKFNDGYKLIQEAVRNKFRLSDDIFQIEWCNLHEIF